MSPSRVPVPVGDGEGPCGLTHRRARESLNPTSGRRRNRHAGDRDDRALTGDLKRPPIGSVSMTTQGSGTESAEFTALTKQVVRVLQAASGPHGFNLGMNQGAVAGAGVAAHLHQHVVPRWSGDSNFLPIVAQTKALPVLLEDTRSRLVAAWPQG